MIAALYDWTGFYIGLNGGWGRAASAGTSNAGAAIAPSARAAMTRAAEWSVARSAIAGRPAAGCSASKRRATGPIFRARTSALFFAGVTNRPRSMRSDCSPARSATPGITCSVREGRRGCYRHTITTVITGAVLASTRPAKPAGAARSEPASNIGFAPNWSVAFEYDHLFMGNRNVTCVDGPLARSRPHRQHP